MSLTVKNLSFGYTEDRPLFSDISLSVNKGESHAILGASGCGKSTLLKLISGLIEKGSEGSIFVAEQEVVAENSKYSELKAQGKIGYMSQFPVLFQHMTVEQNISFPSQIIGTYNEGRIQALIRAVGLEGHEGKLPSQLSGGMITRTALARLFSTQPDFLILDEPFSSLDIARRTSLYKYFHSLKEERSTTTLLVTHDIFEAMVFAPEISLMTISGRLVSYHVRDWRANLDYSEAVERYFSDFSYISDVISQND